MDNNSSNNIDSQIQSPYQPQNQDSAPDMSQMMIFRLWENFMKNSNDVLKVPVEQMLSHELSAQEMRTVLEMMYQQRMQRLSLLEAKRNQIKTQMNQYLQRFDLSVLNSIGIQR